MGTQVSVFNRCKHFHSGVRQLLLEMDIGVRLLTLICLSAFVAVLLATAGLLGLSAANESLRSMYEDRMLPTQQLAKISNLMLTNRFLLQQPFSEVRPGADGEPHSFTVISRTTSAETADTLEKNIAAINELWRIYNMAQLSEDQQLRASQFGQSRLVFVDDALLPAIAALRANQYDKVRNLAARAQELFDQAAFDLQALSQLHFDAAHQIYTDGVQRYASTRYWAFGAVGAALLVLVLLGFAITESIVTPLKKVIAVFRQISEGHYQSHIPVQGRDDISRVMLALQRMQAKLGADEQAIHQLVFYDPLTHLPNRRLLRDRLQRAMSIGTRNHLFGAVLMVDLDNFKSVNDSRGHEVGDRLLVEMALRLQSCIRQSDTVARVGGDEFIVLLVELDADELQAQHKAEAIGQKILHAIHQPHWLAHHLHHGTASMGLCLFMGQSATMDELLKCADISMYQAKSSGRNAMRFYDPQVQARLQARITLESELRDALPAKQLQLYYQIQIDKSQGVLGAEALLRWNHPVHGLVFPDQFIPIAEESGLIVPIGEWVMRTACEQLALWATYPATADYVISVNVSALQFRQPDFVEVVRRVLAHSGANPQRFKLELTESLVLHNIADTVDKMKLLNRDGIHFSMDDFGTGYSSLAHLTSLPIQQLKIDRSFVRNIPAKHSDSVIVKTIIGMAKSLGVAVIAEGVESEEQRACLEGYGCPSYQGYLSGRPVPLEEFEALAQLFSHRLLAEQGGAQLART